MNHQESLEDFYRRICKNTAPQLVGGRPHINVFSRTSCMHHGNFSRRDYYKVTCIIGLGELEFADKIYQIDRPALLFSTPLAPYAWKPANEEQSGWFCIFNEAFVKQRDSLLGGLPMFQPGETQIYFLEDSQLEFIGDIFKKMMAEKELDYAQKDDMMRSYLHIIVHQALKMRPAEPSGNTSSAATRITRNFLELLEAQFPIDTQQQPLSLKTPQDFAQRINIHVNHLNRSVKEVTGKTTTHHIASRLVLEANNLLSYTDWTVAEIAYSLGFDYPAHFNNFYKKHTGSTPKSLREII